MRAASLKARSAPAISLRAIDFAHGRQELGDLAAALGLFLLRRLHGLAQLGDLRGLRLQPLGLGQRLLGLGIVVVADGGAGAIELDGELAFGRRELGDLAPRLGRFAEARHHLVGLVELGGGFRELAAVSQPARLADQMKSAIAQRFIRRGVDIGHVGARRACGLSCRRGRGFSGRAIEEIKGATGQYDDAHRTDDCEAWQPH